MLIQAYLQSNSYPMVTYGTKLKQRDMPWYSMLRLQQVDKGFFCISLPKNYHFNISCHLSLKVFLCSALYLKWLLIYIQKQSKISYFLLWLFNNKMTSPHDRQNLNLAPCRAKSVGEKYLYYGWIFRDLRVYFYMTPIYLSV